MLVSMVLRYDNGKGDGSPVVAENVVQRMIRSVMLEELCGLS
jgi:hypothetical protein